jgi:anthranilate synthase component 1
MKNKVMIPYTKVLSGDTETPITLYQKYVGKEIGFLLESKTEGKGRYSFLGKNPYAVIKGREKIIIRQQDEELCIEGKALEIIKEYMSHFEVLGGDSSMFIGGAVGTVAYDVIRQYEKLPTMSCDLLKTPDVHMMVVLQFITYDHYHGRIILTVLEEESEEGAKRAEDQLSKMEEEIQAPYDMQSDSQEHTALRVQSNMTKEQYMQKVNKAKEYIYEGDIFQVVLSQRWTVDTKEDAFALYRRLRAVNPSPYLFYFNFGDEQVAGSSPEMLVEVRGNTVYTCPIAGTRKRGKNENEDMMLAEELRNDPKEQAEHVMLVDLARNDMGRIAAIGTVQVTDFMKVHYYSHVMHLVSLVEGKKREGQDSFSILSSFLPAGTLSGAPKIRAMEIIEELEPERRGLYGGAAGYFGFNGDMDMCIAIRTMVIRGGKVYMQAGAGIVADSDPEKEYEESENKVKALLNAIGKGGIV